MPARQYGAFPGRAGPTPAITLAQPRRHQPRRRQPRRRQPRPRQPRPQRPWLWLAAAVVLMTATAGCAKFDAALGQRWAVVHFTANTSVSTLLKVRTACSQVPHVRPEALPRSGNPGDLIYAVRYRTDNASDADLARLQQCLQRFPSVTGIDFQDSGDAG